MATDSAQEWDVFLDSCLPGCTWVRAGSRRGWPYTCAISATLPPLKDDAHPSWIAGMKLMLDLLLVFALKRTSLGSVLDCVAPCLEESLLSLAKLRLEEVWKSFTEHTKRVDVWLKNDSEKGP